MLKPVSAFRIYCISVRQIIFFKFYSKVISEVRVRVTSDLGWVLCCLFPRKHSLARAAARAKCFVILHRGTDFENHWMLELIDHAILGAKTFLY